VDIRRLQREYNADPSEKNLDKLFDALKWKTARVSMVETENSNLKEAIILEHQKRQRGKKLNLAGEESQGLEIWSPVKVDKAREYQGELDRIAAEEEAAKAERKVVREANKAKKQQEDEEKAARQAAKQLQKDLRDAAPKVLKRATAKPKTASNTIKVPVLKAPKVRIAPNSPRKKQRQNNDHLVVVLKVSAPDPEVIGLNSRGRTIRLPERFKHTK
jgi:hypothetical protein